MVVVCFGFGFLGSVLRRFCVFGVVVCFLVVWVS